MKNSKHFYAIFIILFSSSVITTISFAQTHIPYGDVSGTWTIEGNPYIIDGHIFVMMNHRLLNLIHLEELKNYFTKIKRFCELSCCKKEGIL